MIEVCSHAKKSEEGALNSKVKEMMALAISIMVGHEGCIAYHVHDTVTAGALRQELLETIGVGIMMGGGRDRSIVRMRWRPLSSIYLEKKDNSDMDILAFLLKLLHGGLGNLAAYLAAYVLLCLRPAFNIAGVMTALISKESVTRFLGRNTPKWISHPAAALAGSCWRFVLAPSCRICWDL